MRTEDMRNMIVAAGGSVDDLPDNLPSTLQKRLIETMGGNCPEGNLLSDICNAFGSCGGAQNVVWEENIGKFDISGLSDSVFFSYFTELCIPEGVTSIGGYYIESYAYDDGEEVCHYDRSKMLYLTNLRKITFPSTLQKIPDSLFETFLDEPTPSKLEEVVISEGVQEIGELAFYYCFDLSSVTIPSTVSTIGENAFNKSAVTRITIHKPEGSIPGAPWGATNAEVIWTG